MKSTIFLATLISVSQALGAIYGVDNRLDINHIPSLRSAASSVAIAVPSIFLVQKSNGNYQMEDVDYLGGGSSVNACMSERFAKQPIIGNCTGFLVGKRHLVTAGHCILPNGIVNNKEHPFCEGFSWYLGFNVNQSGKTSEKDIPKENIYRCTKVVRAENIEVDGEQRNDFAVLELDRDVPSKFVPLKLANRIPKKGEHVYAIGHPSGLPAKYSGLSPVLKATDPYHFEVNLDALAGNSGSPTFDQAGRVLGILISGHPIDYVQDPKGCYKVNTCDSTGRVCKQKTPFEGQQVSNYIQYIQAARPYIPKEKRHVIGR